MHLNGNLTLMLIRLLVLCRTIKQGDSNSGAIICFGTKFKLLVDYTVVEIYNCLEFTLRHCFNDLWDSIYTSA